MSMRAQSRLKLKCTRGQTIAGEEYKKSNDNSRGYLIWPKGVDALCQTVLHTAVILFNRLHLVEEDTDLILLS